MSDEGPSAPPFFRPAAPKRSNQGSKAADVEQPRTAADQVDERPVLSARPSRKGRPPLHGVTWTDAFRVYKMLSSLPREMQQAIIEVVQNDD